MADVDSKTARVHAGDEADRSAANSARSRRDVVVTRPDLVPMSAEERRAAVDAVRAVLLPPARERSRPNEAA